MKNLGRIRWGRVALLIAAIAAAFALTIQMMISMVVSESFKLNPPTEAELAEDPSLAMYLK